MSNATATIASTSSLLRLSEQHEWFMATADAAQSGQQARQQESAASAVAVRIGVAVGILSEDEASGERSRVVRLLSDLAGTRAAERDELRAWLTAYDTV